jgi:hypothetical protein
VSSQSDPLGPLVSSSSALACSNLFIYKKAENIKFKVKRPLKALLLKVTQSDLSKRVFKVSFQSEFSKPSSQSEFSK